MIDIAIRKQNCLFNSKTTFITHRRHDIEFELPQRENQNAHSACVCLRANIPNYTNPIKISQSTMQIMLLKTPNSEQKQGVIIDEKKNLN